ncbi:hypothetical protein DU508_09370 [Pedobacter chinensis]|uniref:Uncharacterized protein n=1 Tax=Pedobacter chinensis TaxID=2282421 RepID=A0A369PYM7_9SPHI|nr:hypothetical protein [Pedobacter chinensis]RDC57362.1 hypothetical protein DU508_09370 [Pedobacter chinensis]
MNKFFIRKIGLAAIFLLTDTSVMVQLKNPILLFLSYMLKPIPVTGAVKHNMAYTSSLYNHYLK